MMKWYVQNIPEARVPSHPSMRPVSSPNLWPRDKSPVASGACEKVWWIGPENCLPTWAKKTSHL